MELVGDYTWEVTIAFTDVEGEDERFKFDVFGDWTLNFGDTDLDGKADEAGADIKVEENKTYKITFLDNTKVYTVVEVTE